MSGGNFQRPREGTHAGPLGLSTKPDGGSIRHACHASELGRRVASEHEVPDTNDNNLSRSDSTGRPHHTTGSGAIRDRLLQLLFLPSGRDASDPLSFPLSSVLSGLSLSLFLHFP